jgi:hypothetical protein
MKTAVYVCVVTVLFSVMLSFAETAAGDQAKKDKAASIPKRMILTTLDGKDILLKEDNTWEPEGGREMIVDKDFTTPLPDGRFVLINADGTWGFVTKEVQYAEDMLLVDRVSAKGSGQSIDVNAATNAARKQAFDNAALKAREAMRNIKINSKKIRQCIDMVEKDVESEENFVKGRGWAVSVTVTLDKGSLLAVVDCARDTTTVKQGK